MGKTTRTCLQWEGTGSPFFIQWRTTLNQPESSKSPSSVSMSLEYQLLRGCCYRHTPKDFSNTRPLVRNIIIKTADSGIGSLRGFYWLNSSGETQLAPIANWSNLPKRR